MRTKETGRPPPIRIFGVYISIGTAARIAKLIRWTAVNTQAEALQWSLFSRREEQQLPRKGRATVLVPPLSTAAADDAGGTRLAHAHLLYLTRCCKQNRSGLNRLWKLARLTGPGAEGLARDGQAARAAYDAFNCYNIGGKIERCNNVCNVKGPLLTSTS